MGGGETLGMVGMGAGELGKQGELGERSNLYISAILLLCVYMCVFFFSFARDHGELLIVQCWSPGNKRGPVAAATDEALLSGKVYLQCRVTGRARLMQERHRSLPF